MLVRETRADNRLPEGVSTAGVVSKSIVPIYPNSALKSHAWGSLYIPTLSRPMELAEVVDVKDSCRDSCLVCPIASVAASERFLFLESASNKVTVRY